ncbi:trypsin-like serine protease [Myxococcaceae bacterium JPH2]|nr:trypsin-like serine protease [Myxococcaceae bacterium JPH2]
MATGAKSQPVVQGTDAPSDPAAVALVARRARCSGEPPVLLCSGALIAPDVVLTAAHCLALLGQDGGYEVFIGQKLLPAPEGRFVRVTHALPHPGFVPETHENDVALLRLARAVDVTPFALPSVSGAVPAVGDVARVLGYGDTKDAQALAGLRRQGMLTVTRVDALAFHAGPSPSMSCVGDSGGPVLWMQSGREVLAGITVSGDVACRTEAVNARVDGYLDDFVRPFLAEVPPGDTSTLHLDALCRESCVDDRECPAGLACVASAGGRSHCVLSALQEGDFGEHCEEDSACGSGVCARLDSEGAEACRCFTPCAAPSEPVDDAPGVSEGNGCASTSGLLPALAGGVILATRRRFRGGCPRGFFGLRRSAPRPGQGAARPPISGKRS